MSSLVHLVNTPFPVPAPPIFPYGKASDPPSPSHESSEEIVTPKGNTLPHDNLPNLVPNLPDDPDSDPSLSDFSLSDSSDSSDDEYYKWRKSAKNNKKKSRIKTCFNKPIKKCVNLTAKLLTSA